MQQVTLPANDWKPRPYQAGFWQYMQEHPFGARAILCHHRRAGKDHTAINWAAVASQQRVGLYLHIFPYANQGRRVIWNGIDRNGGKFLDAFPDALVERRSDLEMRLILKNGSIFQVMGADDPDKLVGINCVGAIFSEFALMDPLAYRLLQPVLNENQGWAIFPSTPRGKNHFYDLTERAKSSDKWYVSVESIETTGAVSLEVIEEDRRMGVEEPLIQQEYYVSFDAALQGAYYEKQMSQLVAGKRVCDLPYDPSLPVHTAWDFGIDDSTAIWFFQITRSGKHFFDHLEDHDQAFNYYVAELKDRSTRGNWIWGSHYAPHDVAQRDFGTGNTLYQTALNAGLRFTKVDKGAVHDGIEAVRQLLPTCRFDELHTARGVEALKSYRREKDEKTQTFRNKPFHDWSSHSADAMRTAAMGLRTKAPVSRDAPQIAYADTDYDPNEF